MYYIVFQKQNDQIIKVVKTPHPLDGTYIYSDIANPGVGVIGPLQDWTDDMRVVKGQVLIEGTQPAQKLEDVTPPKPLKGEIIAVPERSPLDRLEVQYPEKLVSLASVDQVRVFPDIKVRVHETGTGFAVEPVREWPRGVDIEVMIEGIEGQGGRPGEWPPARFMVRRTLLQEKAHRSANAREASIQALELHIPRHVQTNAGLGIYDEAKTAWIVESIKNYGAAVHAYEAKLETIRLQDFQSEPDPEDAAYRALIALAPRWPDIGEEPSS